MVSNRRILQSVSVWDPQHNSYHFIVMGCLRSASPREHFCYLRQRMRLPLKPPGRQKITWADTIFSALQSVVKNPDRQEARHNLGIAKKMWRIIDKRVSARREPGRFQAQLKRMRRTIREALKLERRRQVDTVGEDMERLLTRDPPSAENQGGVYGDGTEHQWTMPHRPLDSHSSESRKSVWNSTAPYPFPPPPPQGGNIPTFLLPSHIDDSIPMED